MFPFQKDQICFIGTELFACGGVAKWPQKWLQAWFPFQAAPKKGILNDRSGNCWPSRGSGDPILGRDLEVVAGVSNMAAVSD